MSDRHKEGQEPAVPLTLGELIRALEWRMELLGGAMVVAESVLIYLLAGFILPADLTNAPYPFLVVLFIMGVAHVVSRLLEVGRVWSPDFEIITTVSIVVSLIVAIRFASFPNSGVLDVGWFADAASSLAFFENDAVRSVWGSVVILIYAWWRARTREEPSIDSAYTLFRWGTFALGGILVIILIAASDDLVIRDRLTVATAGYFGSALVAIAASRMRLEGTRSSSPLEAPWLVTFAAPILAILLVAMLATGLLTRNLFETLVWVLSPLLWLLSVIFQILVLIIAVLAFIILTPIFWLIGDRTVIDSETEDVANPESNREQFQDAAGELFTVPDPLRYLIAAAVLILIVSLLVKFFYRRRRPSRDTVDEQRESVLSWSDLFDDIGNQIRGLFARERPGDPYAELRGDDRWRFTIRVRERYRQLQQRGEELGRSRHPGETAEEYRPSATSLFVDADAHRAVDDMTALYRRVRYSGQPADEHDADFMDERWDTVRHASVANSS